MPATESSAIAASPPPPASGADPSLQKLTLRLRSGGAAGTAPPSSVLPDIRSSSDGCRPATSAPVESRFVPLESAGGPPPPPSCVRSVTVASPNWRDTEMSSGAPPRRAPRARPKASWMRAICWSMELLASLTAGFCGFCAGDMYAIDAMQSDDAMRSRRAQANMITCFGRR